MTVGGWVVLVVGVLVVGFSAPIVADAISGEEGRKDGP